MLRKAFFERLFYFLSKKKEEYFVFPGRKKNCFPFLLNSQINLKDGISRNYLDGEVLPEMNEKNEKGNTTERADVEKKQRVDRKFSSKQGFTEEKISTIERRYSKRFSENKGKEELLLKM